MKPEYDYPFIKEEPSRWARVYLLELLQNRFGKPIVNNKGRAYSRGVTKELADDIHAVTRKPIDEKQIGRQFIAGTDGFVYQFPNTEYIQIYQSYINSTSEGVIFKCNSKEQLKQLARGKVAERQKAQLGEPDLQKGDNILAVNLVEDLGTEEVNFHDSGEKIDSSSSTQGGSVFSRLLESRTHSKSLLALAGFVFLVLTILFFLIRPRSTTTNDSKEIPWTAKLRTFDWQPPMHPGSSIPMVSYDIHIHLKLLIMPFKIVGQECPFPRKIELEPLIASRLQVLITENNLNASVLVSPDSTTVVDDIQARNIGLNADADLVLYGNLQPSCFSDEVSMLIRFVKTDTVTRIDGYNELKFEHVPIRVDNPIDIATSQVIDQAWFVINWMAGMEDYYYCRYSAALQRFELCDRLSQDDFTVSLVSNCMMYLGRTDSAKKKCVDYLQNHSNAASVYIQLGNILKQSGKFDDAMGNYKKATECKPPLDQSWSKLAELLFCHYHKTTEALSCLDSAFRLKPNSITALRLAAVIHSDEPLHVLDAEKYCSAVLAQLPEDTTIRVLHGLSLMRLQEFSLAEQEFRRALSTKLFGSENKTIYDHYSWLLVKQGRYREAYNFLFYAERFPDNYPMRLRLAFVEIQLGHLLKAGTHLRQIVKDFPNLYDSNIALANYYFHNFPNYDSAHYYYERSIRINPRGNVYADYILSAPNNPSGWERVIETLRFAKSKIQDDGVLNYYLSSILFYKKKNLSPIETNEARIESEKARRWAKSPEFQDAAKKEPNKWGVLEKQIDTLFQNLH